jgi:S-DNA-T family DNA segregation ATPase FtsK/SpoIIIE
MAKKRGRRRKAPEAKNIQHEVPNSFWNQVGAVLMILLAIVLVASWFKQPDAIVLNEMHALLIKGLGITSYLLPFVIVYLAVKIFRTPGNRLSWAVWLSSAFIAILFCGMFSIPPYPTAKLGSDGGIVGNWLDGYMVKAMGKLVSFIIYAVVTIITALFMYAETPAELFRKIGSIFSGSRNGEDIENARVMRRNAGVEDDEEEAPRRRRAFSLKVNNTQAVTDEEAPKKKGILRKVDNTNKEPAPAPVAEPSALVAVNDPNWKMPPLSLLNKKRSPADPGDTDKIAHIIEDTLRQFNIDVDVEEANVGPRITQYTLRPPAGVKISKIATYDKELALNLAKSKIRVEAPIPGTRAVGVEVENEKQGSVGLHELLQSPEWTKMISDKPLSFALGKDISGKAVVGNLAKMPHLLIAGTTGSGKSVMTNTLLSSMLYHNSPADLRLIIVDPKQVEMAAYEDIPHLLTPIITDVTKSLSALKWAVNEMERRYSIMAKERVKNIVDYNTKMQKSGGTVEVPDEDGNMQKHDEGKMPYIVVVVDEMADLMMQAGKELEFMIVRIAQKGRAAGIHLVLATQRPEVKVVTGLIKANIPGRIAFAVNNNMDSRVMLDMGGAEKLLGMGDMLYLTTEMMGKPKRVQGAYVSDDEIENLTNYLREQAPPSYNDEVISQEVAVKGMPGMSMSDGGGAGGGGDIERQAAEIAIRARKLSTSLLQRQLRIGYGRAAAIIDHLEEIGVVGPAPGGSKPREVLISSMDEYPE